jgi:hypothetical protein
MKKLLFILFLFPFACTSQPTFTVLASDFNTAGIAVVSGNTYTAGRLYIFFVGTSNDAGTVATTTLSGTGQTWTECTAVGGVANGFRLLDLRPVQIIQIKQTLILPVFKMGCSKSL